MWYSLCNDNIINPTDYEILRGWKIYNGYSNNYIYYYDNDEWIKSVREYIDKYPININVKYNRQSNEHVRNRCRSLKLNAFWKIANKGDFGNIINEDIIRNTKHYTKKSKYPQSINWEKWFDGFDDWKNEVINYLELYPIDNVKIDPKLKD